MFAHEPGRPPALDTMRTVLQTAVAARAPPQDYLLSLLRASPADVTATPGLFTPPSGPCRPQSHRPLAEARARRPSARPPGSGPPRWPWCRCRSRGLGGNPSVNWLRRSCAPHRSSGPPRASRMPFVVALCPEPRRLGPGPYESGADRRNRAVFHRQFLDTLATSSTSSASQIDWTGTMQRVHLRNSASRAMGSRSSCPP